MIPIPRSGCQLPLSKLGEAPITKEVFDEPGFVGGAEAFSAAKDRGMLSGAKEHAEEREQPGERLPGAQTEYWSISKSRGGTRMQMAGFAVWPRGRYGYIADSHDLGVR